MVGSIWLRQLRKLIWFVSDHVCMPHSLLQNNLQRLNTWREKQWVSLVKFQMKEPVLHVLLICKKSRKVVLHKERHQKKSFVFLSPNLNIPWPTSSCPQGAQTHLNPCLVNMLSLGRPPIPAGFFKTITWEHWRRLLTSRELCGHCTTSLQNFFRIFNLVKDTLIGWIALIHCIELGWTQTQIFLASRHKISIMFIFPPRPPHCPKAVRKRLDNKNDATCEICVNALRSLLVGEWVDSAHVTTK